MDAVFICQAHTYVLLDRIEGIGTEAEKIFSLGSCKFISDEAVTSLGINSTDRSLEIESCDFGWWARDSSERGD